MDLFTTLVAQLDRASVSAEPPKPTRAPARKSRTKIRAPCRRCPPQLERKSRSSKSGFCLSCDTYFFFCKKKHAEEHPGSPPLTAEEFLEKHPSSYTKKKPLCRRCPPSLERVSHSRGFCKVCGMGFYACRKRYAKKHPDAPELTPEAFIEQYPSRH